MGRLIYSFSVSLDGFVNAPDGSLDWADVDEEVHFWFNDQARGVGASLYGRRLYDLMAAYWPTAGSDPDATPAMREFAAIWARIPRFVFSTTLDTVDHNSRLVRGDLEEVLRSVQRETDGDVEVGGPTLASEFVRRGLVDEYRLVVHPVVLGGGTPFFPSLATPLRLRLTETRRFGNGATLLAYRRA
jgi:dihydrofolate reductase